MNSGLTLMAVDGINKWTPPRKSGGISRIRTRLNLSVENEQADAGLDGRTRLARLQYTTGHYVHLGAHLNLAVLGVFKKYIGSQLDLLSIPQSGGKNVIKFRWDHRFIDT